MPGYELIGDEEKQSVLDVFDSGGVLFRRGFEALRGDCYKTEEFEAAFSEKMNTKKALAVSSGTAALRVALAALDIGPGDEVITQAFTFVATAEAIIESGATPVCCEIDRTLNMDPVDLERRITKQTKAVIVVHMLGVPARLEEITSICHKRGIKLIEDTAWGCGGNLKGRPLGTWGDIGTFSFDFAKTITTGEGGMLCFNNQRLYDLAAAWHDHGHENNPTVPRWEDTRGGSGFNYRMMELQAAVGLAQLRKLDKVVSLQRKNKQLLIERLAAYEGIDFREHPEGSFDTADALIFLVADCDVALRVRAELLDAGFSTKILPEAYTWHFAGTWDHMPQLLDAHHNDLLNAFPVSSELLGRAVSIPIGTQDISLSLERMSQAVKQGIS